MGSTASRAFVLAVALHSTIGAASALAHSIPDTMLLASTSHGGGALTLSFDFTTVARVSYSASIGPVVAYASVLPAFEGFAADDSLAGLYQLNAGTVVTLTVTDVQPGRTAIQVGATVLDKVGESATLGVAPLAHLHPDWQLFVSGDATGEGSISFHLSATGPTAYADSTTYTIRLSNGPIPPFAFDGGSFDSGAVACQAAVAKSGAKLIAKTIATLQKCLLAVVQLQAKQALLSPPADLGTTQAAAEAACVGIPGAAASSTPLGRVEALATATAASLASKCGSFLDDRSIADHVAAASCRAQASLALQFPSGRRTLSGFLTQPSQGGDPMSGHLPCLHATIGG